MNVLCVKWGDKYSADYVNRLYRMICKQLPVDFDFYCYTDCTQGIDKDIKTVSIETEQTVWWCKLDLLNIFSSGDNILLDLDVIALQPLERLCAVKTRTVSVLYSSWKEGYLKPRAREHYPTLYNSSVMKWSGSQGEGIHNYFEKHKDMILTKYKGVDRFLFNEPVDVDLLPTGIAYSYWHGARYLKDTSPEKLRPDYEICIFNKGEKPHTLNNWVSEYWK